MSASPAISIRPDWQPGIERNLALLGGFGELLAGFAFTAYGWVQSYGSRCVKPPLIFGDVERAAPMTVRWSSHAQSLTDKPVKGMLTGPVTMLNWSFVRDGDLAEQLHEDGPGQGARLARAEDETDGAHCAREGGVRCHEPTVCVTDP